MREMDFFEMAASWTNFIPWMISFHKIVGCRLFDVDVFSCSIGKKDYF